MKHKKLQTKLTFNKQTVASLNKRELTKVHGGDFTDYPVICTGETCLRTNCAPSKCDPCY